MKYKDFVKKEFKALKNSLISAPEKMKAIAAKWRGTTPKKSSKKKKK
jgi:hypothetical protein